MNISLLIKQYIRFIFGGGIGLLINIGITAFFTEIFGLWHMYAYTVGLSINVIFNFFYHRNITFKIYDRVKNRFLYGGGMDTFFREQAS